MPSPRTYRNDKPRGRSRSRSAGRFDKREEDRERRPTDRERDSYRPRRSSRSRSPAPSRPSHRSHKSRSRSRSRSRKRRRSVSRSPSRDRKANKSRPTSPEETSARRKPKDRSRSHSILSASSSSSSRRRHKRKKHGKRSRSRDRDYKERKKDRKKDKKDKKKKQGTTPQWGKYGIITETDIFTKGPEFYTWLVEERKINPETISKDQNKKEFSRFVEDFNTATLPHEKYYHMEAYERRMSALRSGEFVPPPDDSYDPNADMRAHQSTHKKKVVEHDSYLNKEQLLELRKVQHERIEAGKMKLLGMDVKQNMGVRMDGSMFDG